MFPDYVKGLFPFPFPFRLRQNSGMGKFSLAKLDFHLDKMEMNDTQASKEAGLGSSYIRDLRRKGGSPTAENVAKLAHVLKTTVGGLMDEDDEQKPEGSPQFFSEDDIRSAVYGVLLSYRSTQKDPKEIAGLVIAVLNARALDVSDTKLRA